MLSVDNLFVFQLVFKSYVTPETHIERCLFWGIAGAVLLRDLRWISFVGHVIHI